MIKKFIKIMKNEIKKYLDSQAEGNLRAFLIGLMYHCPLTGKNPLGCPLYEIRKEIPNNWIKIINSLSISEIKDICERHFICERTGGPGDYKNK